MDGYKFKEGDAVTWEGARKGEGGTIYEFDTVPGFGFEAISG